MQINRKGIPTEIKDVKEREPLSSDIYWRKDGPLSLSSYVMKTSTGKKNVLMLSTLEPLLGTTKDNSCHKLGLYKLYDFKRLVQILLTSIWDFTRQKNLESGPW